MNISDTVTEATSVLADQPLLRRAHGTALVSGDIHGDIEALNRIIEMRDDEGAKYLILLGDYVDRGDHQIEVVHKIAEQMLEDQYFIPLRGNHEDIMVCSRYGFTHILDDRGIDAKPIMELFSHLPNALETNNIFMAHGGIPIDPDFRISEINDYERGMTVEDDNQKQLFWNDPIFIEEEQHLEVLNSPRGPKIWQFGVPVTDKFLEQNGKELVIRAHIAFKSGFKWIQERRILSLFSSSSGVYHRHNRKAALLTLDDPSSIEIRDL